MSASDDKIDSISECWMMVNTSGIQKALYAILAASSVINLMVIVWWTKHYRDKRKRKKQGMTGDQDMYAEDADIQVPSKGSTRPMELDVHDVGMKPNPGGLAGGLPDGLDLSQRGMSAGDKLPGSSLSPGGMDAMMRDKFRAYSPGPSAAPKPIPGSFN